MAVLFSPRRQVKDGMVLLLVLPCIPFTQNAVDRDLKGYTCHEIGEHTQWSMTSNTSTSENGSRNVLKPMDSEQLREYGHRMVDFVADYYKTIESFPVLSQVQPGYLHNLLPDSAPDHSETLEQVLDDVKVKILPGVTHWQSPSFFAFYPSNSSVAGFLGDILSTGLGIVGFSWITSPAATELEIIVLDWLAKLLNLPEQFLSKGYITIEHHFLLQASVFK
ncbi:hypothetical protein Bca4012_061261 [Brassica carinata]